MTLSRTNTALSILLILVVAMLLFVGVDYSQPNYQVTLGDDMSSSPAYRAYDPNTNFANGRTLQPPAPGTIARGASVLHFSATPDDATRAGEQLVNPYGQDNEARRNAIERGGVRYRIYCTPCHGNGGIGDGPVTKRGFPPPPSLLTGKSFEMKDGQLFHILTYGQNNMPNFAAQLSPDQRWDVIVYIRDLQSRASDKRAPTATPSVEERVRDADEGSSDTPPSDDEESTETKVNAPKQSGQPTTPGTPSSEEIEPTSSALSGEVP